MKLASLSTCSYLDVFPDQKECFDVSPSLSCTVFQNKLWKNGSHELKERFNLGSRCNY